MNRNKALTILQKTYDDAYLSCSTAVYYEGQGDESEATRHWRSALEQIYEHNAIRIPSTYIAQTDTERALQDALKQLELQCKERIDILEALRVSRQAYDDSRQADMDNLKTSRSASSLDYSNSYARARGAIGQGTIPAVAYSDLSRPALPQRPSRPSLPDRTSTEEAVILGPGPGQGYSSNNFLDVNSGVDRGAASSSAPPPSNPYTMPSRPDRTERSASPEKRTMRTTLRSGKSGEKPKLSRKSSRPAAEGPSKAATMAWAAIGSREKLLKAPSSDAVSATTSPSPHQSQERTRYTSGKQMHWDSHTRRLVAQRDADLAIGAASSVVSRQSEDFAYTKPSQISVSAASNALSQTSLQETSSSGQTQNPLPDLRSSHRDAGDDSGEGLDQKYVSGISPRRKPITRNTNGQTRRPREISHLSRPRQPISIHASDSTNSDENRSTPQTNKKRDQLLKNKTPADISTDDSLVQSDDEIKPTNHAWEKNKAKILKNLPPGVEESAAKQILNDIIVQGDEVRWGDIAGLEIAKNALRETVVYPFLRPDLFSGLREPARGMLLFGPPGTGKTMLARAVATESRSTFFSISASSLTSKYLGESEKLVRALFGLARTLAPSIIFVDEIDSLLSQRSGSGEHEATRRIKTEFLIQWSDLQRAAAGREVTERDKERGDANRVLVLAATNLPWAIDEAARRRFVRRQYIPLPEATTRETQLRTLLGQQKHSLLDGDILKLCRLTEGFSGSDITALAKDAAMGPLRSLGEALLHMKMDEIRPIALVDFEASLGTIRPSVSKTGLKEYEDWASEFGERGG